MQEGNFARLRGDHPHRVGDPGRADLDPVGEADRDPRAGRDRPAQRGFNIIATANTRDRGVNEMSAALKRRFNFVTVPVVDDLEQEIRIVTKREAELRTDYQVGVEPPAELAQLLVTVFQELRAGRDQGRQDQGEAAGLGPLDRGGDQRPLPHRDPPPALRRRGGRPPRSPPPAPRRGGQRGGRGPKAVREYCETVAKGRGGLWKEFYAAGRQQLKDSTSLPGAPPFAAGQRGAARIAGRGVAGARAR